MTRFAAIQNSAEKINFQFLKPVFFLYGWKRKISPEGQKKLIVSQQNCKKCIFKGVE